METSPFPYISQILEQLPDGVVACDTLGNLSYFNQTLRAWHGLPESAVASDEWATRYSLYHQDAKTLLTPEEIPLKRAFNGETLINVPMVIAIPGEEPRYCEASGGPLIGPEGNKVGAFVIMHDVTTLVRSRDLLQKAIETSIAGFDIVNDKGQFIYANRAYLDMWGYQNVEEVLGKSPADHCADPETPGKIITALKEKGECTIEFKAQRKDKSLFDVLMSARLDHDRDGREIYPTFSMDLTEIKKAINSRDVFLSIASHELLTPLTSLKLQTQIFRRKHGQSNEELAKYLDNSLRFIGRLNRLVEDMLDISRITTGKFTLQIAEADIAEILRRKFLEFKTRYPNEKIKLILERDSVVVNVDSMRFEQVVDNLVTNATRYASGSEILITLSEKKLSVKDSGPGIPLASQKKIFERFERLSESDVTGLGLGLSIVQEIVALHGWTIFLQSSAGAGADFFIHFN